MPGIVENEEGWGPTSVPEHLEGVPYAPYGKGDKVGRVSDFTQSGFNKYGGECCSPLIDRAIMATVPGSPEKSVP